MGVFEKPRGRHPFTLTHYLPAADAASESGCLAGIRENIGWELIVSPDLVRITPPTREELVLLRLFDPERFFIGD